MLNAKWATGLVLLAVTALAGCATTGGAPDPDDPWEGTNRAVYKFNDGLDRATLKPLAKGYRKVTPGFMRTGVSNFYDNLTTPRSAINNFLQGKPGRGVEDIIRFLTNSTVGAAGVLDVASYWGMEEYDEDFSQTFAVWGLNKGPYVYLPVFGPHTLSDVLALPFDTVTDPLFHYDNTSIRDKLVVLRAIDVRTRLLSAEALIEDSKDPYVSIREAYLQNREFRIYDGDPPTSEEDDDLFDEFLDED